MGIREGQPLKIYFLVLPFVTRRPARSKRLADACAANGHSLLRILQTDQCSTTLHLGTPSCCRNRRVREGARDQDVGHYANGGDNYGSAYQSGPALFSGRQGSRAVL